jgi:hypothetical protein
MTRSRVVSIASISARCPRLLPRRWVCKALADRSRFARGSMVKRGTLSVPLRLSVDTARRRSVALPSRPCLEIHSRPASDYGLASCAPAFWQQPRMPCCCRSGLDHAVREGGHLVVVCPLPAPACSAVRRPASQGIAVAACCPHPAVGWARLRWPRSLGSLTILSLVPTPACL